MIRDFFILHRTNNFQCIIHRSYTRTPLDPDLISTLLLTVNYLFEDLAEHNVKLIKTDSFALAFSLLQDLAIIFCLNETDNNDATITKKVLNLSHFFQRLKKTTGFEFGSISEMILLKQTDPSFLMLLDHILISEIKVALCGFGGVGKTTILKLLQDIIELEYIPTMFVAYTRLSGILPDNDVIIWDLAGQEGFTPLWRLFLRGTHLILLVTDSTVENVLDTKKILKSLIRPKFPQAIVYGICNKQDYPRALKPELIKKIWEIEEAFPLCAIDQSQGRSVKRIIIQGVMQYFKHETSKESLFQSNEEKNLNKS